jgi:hypothetical protein
MEHNLINYRSHTIFFPLKSFTFVSKGFSFCVSKSGVFALTLWWGLLFYTSSLCVACNIMYNVYIFISKWSTKVKETRDIVIVRLLLTAYDAPVLHKSFNRTVHDLGKYHALLYTIEIKHYTETNCWSHK